MAEINILYDLEIIKVYKLLKLRNYKEASVWKN